MDELKLGKRLNELVEEFGGTGESYPQKFSQLAQEARKNNRRLAQSVSNLNDSLDYLRICIKYLIFDLEATRRENKCLRQMLEEKE